MVASRGCSDAQSKLNILHGRLAAVGARSEILSSGLSHSSHGRAIVPTESRAPCRDFLVPPGACRPTPRLQAPPRPCWMASIACSQLDRASLSSAGSFRPPRSPEETEANEDVRLLEEAGH